MNENLSYPSTVQIDAICKFCGMALSLQVDSEYADFGDPLKLARMSSCNRCADMRTDRRRLTHALVKACNSSAAIPRSDAPAREAAVARIRKALQGYCALIADWRNHPFTSFTDELVDEVMDKPNSLGSVVSRLWR